jgi:hypothetical protein
MSGVEFCNVIIEKYEGIVNDEQIKGFLEFAEYCDGLTLLEKESMLRDPVEKYLGESMMFSQLLFYAGLVAGSQCLDCIYDMLPHERLKSELNKYKTCSGLEIEKLLSHPKRHTIFPKMAA